MCYVFFAVTISRHQMETFPRYWPFVREIHRSRWNPRTKASYAELWFFFVISAWVNDLEAVDLRRNPIHYDVIVMYIFSPDESMRNDYLISLKTMRRSYNKVQFTKCMHNGRNDMIQQKYWLNDLQPWQDTWTDFLTAGFLWGGTTRHIDSPHRGPVMRTPGVCL